MLHFFKEDGFQNFLYWLRNLPNSIVLNSWVIMRNGEVSHVNFGDDLNVFMIEALSGKKVSIYFGMWKKIFDYKNYLCIGSIIEDMTNKHSIVWGAGAMYGGDHKLAAIPQKVFAVRGKKSREYLLAHDVLCPAVYGDPAILLPLVYMPKVQKTYKYGIIPHITELGHPIIDNIRKSDNSRFHVIHFKDYESWLSVIDEICSCEYILSSSLHGLIVSNAYGIPNRWIKLSEGILGGDFKYKDYYSSLSDEDIKPLILENADSIDSNMLDIKDFLLYDVTTVQENLVSSCPFLSNSMKEQYMELIRHSW